MRLPLGLGLRPSASVRFGRPSINEKGLYLEEKFDER